VEWKTRGTNRAKTTASPIEHRSESQKRSHIEAREIVRSHQNTSNTQSRIIVPLRSCKKTDTVPQDQIDTLPKTSRTTIASDSTKQQIAQALEKNKRISRRTNFAIIGDALTVPLSLWLDINVFGNDGINALLYSVLIAIPLLIALLVMRLIQGAQKRSLVKMDQGLTPKAVKKIEAAQIWAILALVTSFTVLSPILFGIISMVLFIQAKQLGVDEEYYKKKRRITRLIYGFAVIFPIFIAIIAILI
jgi:uncharacterized membrane protein